jgi:hypothetical protein
MKEGKIVFFAITGTLKRERLEGGVVNGACSTEQLRACIVPPSLLFFETLPAGLNTGAATPWSLESPRRLNNRSGGLGTPD